MKPISSLWLLIPAAGIGQRMQADRPKQYLSLAGRPLLVTTLLRLYHALPEAHFMLVLHPQDRWWPACHALLLEAAPNIKLLTTQGGAERADSVFAGLQALANQAEDDDWVLVHDGARPCITRADIEHLLSQLQSSEQGGLLATPLADTLKQANPQQETIKTLDRRTLWLALTPQMFRYQMLYQALEQALAASIHLTDEASAMEWAGYQPKLVPGRKDNIKITQPEDLAYAEWLLASSLTY